MYARLNALTLVALLLPGVLRAADNDDAPLAKVSGTVTLDGKRLAVEGDGAGHLRQRRVIVVRGAQDAGEEKRDEGQCVETCVHGGSFSCEMGHRDDKRDHGGWQRVEFVKTRSVSEGSGPTLAYASGSDDALSPRDLDVVRVRTFVDRGESSRWTNRADALVVHVAPDCDTVARASLSDVIADHQVRPAVTVQVAGGTR